MSIHKVKFYASIYNVVDHHRDVIVKGAFANTIKHYHHHKQPNIPLLWQHDVAKPIGKIIHMQEDDIGLLASAIIDNAIVQGKEAISLLQNGILSAFSIGFFTRKFRNSPQNIRYIYDIDLKEVSLVTLPSNGYAKILPKVI